MFTNILIATDGSAIADNALDHAIELAADHKALLTVITVTNPGTTGDKNLGSLDLSLKNMVDNFDRIASVEANEILNAASDKAARSSVKLKKIHVKNKPPAEAIVQASLDEECDLIVMGTHGWRGLRRMLLGSQACEVLATSNKPVLIWK